MPARHEFRVAQMLDHPNLIKIYALETARDWLFRIRKVHLLIEYVEGKTLDTFGRFPIPKLVQIFERIASATLWPCEIKTSTRRSFATISSGLYCFLGIAVLLRAKTIAQGGPLHWGRIT